MSRTRLAVPSTCDASPWSQAWLIRSFAAVAVALTIGVAACGGEAGSSTPGPIAFAARPHASDAPGWQVVAVNPDGTGFRLLTGENGEGGPAWSPDGTQIALERGSVDCDDACSAIWVTKADGTGGRPLTSISGRDEGPAWSPDGKSIAFGRWNNRDDLAHLEVDIYVISAVGGEPRRLTDLPGQEQDPTWSPDGERIAFSGDRGDNFDLYVINADGSALRRLTDTPDDDHNPAWAPDGKTIAFARAGRFDHTRIVLMNDDGSAQREIGARHTDWYDPAWSPDGRQIAFTTGDDSTVWTADADGRNVRKVWSEELSSPSDVAWGVAQD